MRARARIVVVADPLRGSRLATVRGEPPLLPRRTLATDPAGGVQLHLVGGAAGPLGGDDLGLEIEVGPGARLCVRSVAASLALPGAAGGASRLHVTARVAAGGVLRWLPEPLIGAAGCDHVTVTEVDCAEGAALYWREELVCGRYAEPGGDVRISTTLRYGGRTLLRNDVAVGPQAPGWSGPAVLGGARVVGSVLVVDPAWARSGPPPAAGCPPAVRPDVVVSAGRPDAVTADLPDGVPADLPTDVAAAVLPLAGGPAVLVNAVGSDPRAVRAQLDRLSRRERWERPDRSEALA